MFKVVLLNGARTRGLPPGEPVRMVVYRGVDGWVERFGNESRRICADAVRSRGALKNAV
ncbi:MAG TPA: hypothetical protein VEX70_04545 [Pyrinomonadaceae bacterium]|nr:hypothetical protein [Pyrinomonadaceae bacterium]